MWAKFLSDFVWSCLTYWLTYAICWELNICPLFKRDISMFIMYEGFAVVQPRQGRELSMCWILSTLEVLWELNSLLLQCWPCEKSEEQRMMLQCKHQMTVKVSFLPSHICTYCVFYRRKVSKHSILGWFWRNHLPWILSFAFFLLLEFLCLQTSCV